MKNDKEIDGEIADRKLEELILGLNASAMGNFAPGNQIISNNQHRRSSRAEPKGKTLTSLKQCEKILMEESLARKSKAIDRLLSVTLNNLGVYYKKTKKPKVALSYIKRALKIEVTSLNDHAAVGSTHLNIAAIFSVLKQYFFGFWAFMLTSGLNERIRRLEDTIRH